MPVLALERYCAILDAARTRRFALPEYGENARFISYSMSKRIGVVTGGGDCPGLNAVIRAVAKAAARRGWECIGILGGYEGLLEPQHTMSLDYQRLSGLLTRGGTILGTANRGKFAAKVGYGEDRALPKELLDGVKSAMDALGLSALVCIGGDGTLSIAQQLFEYGIPVVGVPKTIDNDLEGTLFTFGFDSAVSSATDALDRLHTTAESHNRVMVLEVMNETKVARHFAHSRAAQQPIIFLMQSASVVHEGPHQLGLQLLGWPLRDVLAFLQVIISRGLDLLQ